MGRFGAVWVPKNWLAVWSRIGGEAAVKPVGALEPCLWENSPQKPPVLWLVDVGRGAQIHCLAVQRGYGGWGKQPQSNRWVVWRFGGLVAEKTKNGSVWSRMGPKKLVGSLEPYRWWGSRSQSGGWFGGLVVGGGKNKRITSGLELYGSQKTGWWFGAVPVVGKIQSQPQKAAVKQPASALLG